MNDISFLGVKTILVKFDQTGTSASLLKWSILKGTGNIWFKIYYDNNIVLQCADGVIQGGFGFKDEKKLIKQIKKIYIYLA